MYVGVLIDSYYIDYMVCSDCLERDDKVYYSGTCGSSGQECTLLRDALIPSIATVFYRPRVSTGRENVVWVLHSSISKYMLHVDVSLHSYEVTSTN